MSGFFYFVWFVTFIAFIVYWWKKKSARKKGGNDYINFPPYQQISKTKRIIGAVCLVSFFLGIATTPSMTPEEKAQIEAEKQAKAEKIAAEKAAKEAADKAAKEKQDSERAANLTGDDKSLFDAKFQEYKATLDENSARAKALADVDAAINEREAAAKKAAEEAKAAAEKAQKEQSDREKLEQSITKGWDTSDVKSQDNFEKAARIIGSNAAYVAEKSPVWVDPETALRKPWDFYGKVVAFSGVVGDSNQAPPGHSVAKIWGGKYTYGVIHCGDVPIGFHIKSDSDRLRVGQQVTIKGFIVGQDELTNNFGGSPKGVEFVGIVE